MNISSTFRMLSFLIVGCLAGCGGVEPAPPPATLNNAITAKQLWNEHQQDKVIAGRKYRKRTLKVTGLVIDKGPYHNAMGPKLFIRLHWHVEESPKGKQKSKDGIMCIFEESALAQLRPLKRGQEVTVQGTCQGIPEEAISVLLQECRLLQD